MPTIKLPWQELAEDTYRSVFSQTKTAFDISGVWLLVAMLLVFMGFGIYPQLTADDLGGVEAYLSLPVLLGLFGLIGLSIFATRWTRWVTLEHLPQPGQGMKLGKAEMKVGWALVECLVLGLIPILGGLLAAPTLNEMEQLEAALAVQAVGFILGGFLLARLGMAVNLAALQVPGDALLYALRLTRGQSLRLFLLLVITAGPAILAAWGMGWLLEWALEPMPDLLAPEAQQSLLLIMTAALGFLGAMLFFGAMGLAARSLILAGEDPWGGANEDSYQESDEVYAPPYEEPVSYEESAPYAAAPYEEEVLDTQLVDLVEEPLPQPEYGGFIPSEEDVLLLRGEHLVDSGQPNEADQLVPVDSNSWLEGRRGAQAQPNFETDAHVLGRKIMASKKKKSLSDFLPKIRIDVGNIASEGWKLGVLLVLIVFGYLFLFTDILTDFLL
ncbi:MAG: hypothetical protein HQL45_13410 [Alphaproteobacteria bacterium]|nr:hypothetical protein [Alphaproteobacteria bacterium]